MNKPKHTPGPWDVDGTSPHRTINGPEFTVAMIHQPRLMELPESEANARLIAAAPELLAVLQDYIADQNGEKILSGMELWRRMNDAVRKATGGAE